MSDTMTRRRIEDAFQRLRRRVIQPEPQRQIHCYYCGRTYRTQSAFGWHFNFYH